VCIAGGLWVFCRRMAEQGAFQISEQDVRHVARLSRLRLTDDEVRRFTDQLAHVLKHIAKINELDLEGVEPLTHPLDLRNVLREDVIAQPLPIDRVLANAPEKVEHGEFGFFGVPRVLGDGGGA
jgi:aspartyl-tRNA(Asn)/glutamyl-tRNA(Gln) amidotransferase subunit C